MNPYQVNRGVKRRVVVLFDSGEVDSLDRLGVEIGMTSRAETVRHLLRDAIKEKGPAGASTPPSHDHHREPLARNHADE